MNIRKLSYLSAIIEQGSFRKAADKLSMSQPALSKSIERLEDELGVKLLDRSHVGITPTAFGEILYSHAKSICDEMELAERQIQNPGQVVPSSITFGTLPTLGSGIIPRAIGRWRSRDPHTMLRVVEKVQAELLLDLARGHLDFIIAKTEYYDYVDDLRQRVLFRDRLCIFARPGHPLFGVDHLTWPAMTAYPWVVTMVGRQKSLFTRILDAQGVELPTQVIECSSMDFTRSLVAESDHLALLPAYCNVYESGEGRIVPLPIAIPEFGRDIAVIFRARAPLERASRELVSVIEEVGEELASERPARASDVPQGTPAAPP